MNRTALLLTALAAALTLSSCSGDRPAGTLSLEYERYELPNGLDVILHVDRSDPMAAVAMTFHVGSAREVPGRTGFAHLFEHLFFLDSENLGPGGLDRLMTRIGSSTNGSTTTDRTNYFEVVPIDGLEKALWAESDKLGFFINTVTEDVLAKEKQVVKNEKRQGVDNRPYGHTGDVLDRALYPEGHPYRWQVIGSLQDLDAATLADVKAFHAAWYGPNNATLVVAGDIDVDSTKAWIARYFGEIPSRPMPESPAPPEVSLAESRRLQHEDRFARLPELTMAWPSVPHYHPDAAALGILADLLADGKASPFYRVIVKEKQLAPAVSAYAGEGELAGTFELRVRGFAEIDLDSVAAAVDGAFARFESEGIPAEQLARVKAGAETAFYSGLSSVLGKAFSLAEYSIFAGDPGFATEELRRILAVTPDDVMRVYERYVKGRPYVATSFVPVGRPELGLDGAETAEVYEEPIVQGAEAPVMVDDRGTIERTSSAIDRSVEPGFGPTPTVPVLPAWTALLPSGLPVFGVEDRELPLVQFELRFRGGHLAEPPGKTGVASLLAGTLLEGTATRTAEELELAIDGLGASIRVSSSSDEFTIQGSTLARNWTATIDLVREILHTPRWDAEAFERARQRTLASLEAGLGEPTTIAGNVFSRLVFGDHPLAENPLGTPATVATITIDDLKAYHGSALGLDLAAFHVAGAVTRDEALAAAARVTDGMTASQVAFPGPPAWDAARAGLYFVDVPGAKQSVLTIGRLAVARTDPDWVPAEFTNFRLGGGGFASELTQVLREQKGYTYGISSRFSGTDVPGPFRISSSVRSNITLEALDLVKGILERHGPDFDAEDLEITKNYFRRSSATRYETLGAKLGVLATMSDYGLPADYVQAELAAVDAMTVDRVRGITDRFLRPPDMVWLVVGDGATQRARLAALGLGPVREVTP